MSVITISRGTMSGGKMIAEDLAAQLGYRCIDRDIIVEKAAASGVSHHELKDALDKPPTILERLRHKKYRYLALIQASLTDEVRAGRAVYHGHAGHLLLKGGGPVFRVRIIAPMDFRVAMAQKRLRLHSGEAAAYIRKMDEDRKRWTHYLYSVDWTDPAYYDLVINLEHVAIQDAAEEIAHLARRRPCFDFDAKCQAQMNDLAVASRVKAALALNAPTEHIEFEVVCAGGQVVLSAKLLPVELTDEVKRVAAAAPGVRAVSLAGTVATIVA